MLSLCKQEILLVKSVLFQRPKFGCVCQPTTQDWTHNPETPQLESTYHVLRAMCDEIGRQMEWKWLRDSHWREDKFTTRKKIANTSKNEKIQSNLRAVWQENLHNLLTQLVEVLTSAISNENDSKVSPIALKKANNKLTGKKTFRGHISMPMGCKKQEYNYLCSKIAGHSWFREKIVKTHFRCFSDIWWILLQLLLLMIS